jgi:S-adenosylmethionine-dependent methyltransferase
MRDRNFDDIAEKFSRNIYGTTKGQLRQAILWQDLDRFSPKWAIARFVY